MTRAWILFLGSILLHLALLALWPGSAPIGSDAVVYRAAAAAVVHGVPLYDHPVAPVYQWTYTPFGALVMVPLAVVPRTVLIDLGMSVQALVLVPVLGWAVRAMRPGTPLLSPMAVSLAAAALWLEPVWLTIALGQVNLLLLALVVIDLVRPRPTSWQGVLVGIAAGIKLTPLIFVVYLLLVGRRRAAATALGAFAATVGLGFLVLPADSRGYWAGTFLHTDRVGLTTSLSNQSLKGLVSRAGLAGEPLTVIWLVLAVALAAAGLAAAVVATRRGDPLLAVAIVGMTGAAVSPFSWEHHWVWLMLLLVDLVLRRAYLAAGLGYVLTVAWLVSLPPVGSYRQPDIGLFSLRSWPWLEQVTGNLYVLVLLATLVATAWIYRRRSATTLVTLGA